MLFISCSLFEKEKVESEEEIFNKVSFTTNPSEVDDIDNYSANVKTYTERSDLPYDKKLVNEYKISTKIIDNNILTRLDYPDFNGSYRSTLISSDEIILFDRKSNKIEQRLSNDNLLLKNVKLKTLFPLRNIENIKTEFNKLSYKITENNEVGYLIVETPLEILDKVQLEGKSLIDEKIYYDLKSGVTIKEEYTTITHDNVTVKTEISREYTEINGNIIERGNKKVVSYDYPFTLDISDRLIPSVTNIDDLEFLTDSELEEIIAEGGEVYEFDPIIGDPSNPDYTETITTVYENISTDEISESLIKISFME